MIRIRARKIEDPRADKKFRNIMVLTGINFRMPWVRILKKAKIRPFSHNTEEKYLKQSTLQSKCKKVNK